MNKVALAVGGGVFLASVSVFILICFLVTDFVGKTTDPVSAVANCLSAAGTFLAALAALHIAGQQRKIEAEKRLDDLLRRNQAARTIFSVSLIVIDKYLQECLVYLKWMSEAQRGTAPAVSAFPAEILPNLQECVEFASDENRLKLATAIQNIQIFHSRFRGRVEKVDSARYPGSGNSELENAIFVIYIFSLFFEYARNLKYNIIPDPVKDDCRSSARVRGVYEEDFEAVYKLIDTRKDGSWDINRGEN